MTEVNGFQFDISKEGAILRSYTGEELDVVIPDIVDGAPVIKIGNDVFLKSKIKSVIIPKKLNSLSPKEQKEYRKKYVAKVTRAEEIRDFFQTNLAERDAMKSRPLQRRKIQRCGKMEMRCLQRGVKSGRIA